MGRVSVAGAGAGASVTVKHQLTFDKTNKSKIYIIYISVYVSNQRSCDNTIFGI